jgi:type IV pilus assembly protein PilC
MPRYKYIAEGNDGFAANGTIEAESPAGAGLALMERGLFVKKLTEQKSLLQYEIARKRVSRKDLMHFSRQLAVFLRAGVPIIDALDIIRQELPPKKLLGSVLADMIEALRSGSTFTAAAVTHPEAFPPFYIGVLEAAEMTGHLDHSLDEVANYIDRDLEARRKVQSALFYPAVVFLMSITTVLVLTTFVLPRFKTFFEELNAELPLPTRILLAGSGLVSKGWPLILLLLVGSIGTVVYGLRTEQGRAIRDQVLLRIPVVGDLVRTAIIERFCRTLSSMVRSGVPLPDALVVAANGTNNVVYREGLSEVQALMLAGPGRSHRHHRAVPRCGQADDPGGRGDRHARRPARNRGRLLRARPGLQDRPLHQPVRTGRDPLHGCRRRLRGCCPDQCHVRHLRPDQQRGVRALLPQQEALLSGRAFCVLSSYFIIHQF